MVFLTNVIFTTVSASSNLDVDTSFTTNPAYVRFTTFSDLIVLDKIVVDRSFCYFFTDIPGYFQLEKWLVFLDILKLVDVYTD